MNDWRNIADAFALALIAAFIVLELDGSRASIFGFGFGVFCSRWRR